MTFIVQYIKEFTLFNINTQLNHNGLTPIFAIIYKYLTGGQCHVVHNDTLQVGARSSSTTLKPTTKSPTHCQQIWANTATH